VTAFIIKPGWFHAETSLVSAFSRLYIDVRGAVQRLTHSLTLGKRQINPARKGKRKNSRLRFLKKKWKKKQYRR